MNGRYLFQVGDRVRHSEDQHIVGTITKLVSVDEDSGEKVDKIDPQNPWYTIEWNTGECYIGFEHECSLVPEYVNPIPSLFIQSVFRSDRKLWKTICDDVREKYNL